ncbi:hypothetical protein GGS23DRAFT_620218 [Durotheca rogersii]|uniref:uncharacterized protein n=1 Tax=Durotheca rogersii TaxID=419775 RepID=UPI00221F2244|nr:uncharacterized protein GGS23DRAFT_620218 [Durotheca rogersii]KAI5864385.1 hypothetical protein GGS23DRAFT_620218 [Durotheca rogersii]
MSGTERRDSKSGDDDGALPLAPYKALPSLLKVLEQEQSRTRRQRRQIERLHRSRQVQIEDLEARARADDKLRRQHEDEIARLRRDLADVTVQHQIALSQSPGGERDGPASPYVPADPIGAAEFHEAYAALFTALDNWIFKWLEAAFVDREELTTTRLPVAAAGRSRSAANLAVRMARHRDVAALARFEGRDEDVLVALAARWLHDEVLVAPLVGVVFPEEVRAEPGVEPPPWGESDSPLWWELAAADLERAGHGADPTRRPEYAAARAARVAQLTRELAALMRFPYAAALAAPQRRQRAPQRRAAGAAAARELRDTVVAPALRLRERLHASEATLGRATFAFPEFAGGPAGAAALRAHPDRFELRDLSAEDALARSGDGVPVCALRPACTFRRAAGRDALGAPGLVYVASRSADEGRRFRDREPTFMAELFDKLGVGEWAELEEGAEE